ncbi:Hypothetical predicted protein [Paramuricea clavata]|uniref:Uncharacterized protein n=1 Tax=Paramuricea clavata TaxID=317549 RepID=A0A6S7IWP1_PARCT|nr:Hypothetical predicted protein [Paramuricea clavata]
MAKIRIVINTLSNLLVLNFEPVSWSYTLPPDRPESLGTLNNFAGAPPRSRSRSYVRAQKLARGAHVDKLIQPAVSVPSFSCLLDRSLRVTPFSLRRTSRVTSAPANVTRQVTQSIEQHVQRINRARQQTPPEVGQSKPRPQSSPAHLRTYVSQTQANSSVLPTEGSIIIKGNLKPPTQPDPLPSKNNWHGITRGRSAPAIRTNVLSGKERGWTTSAKDVILPHNKLMRTAAQAREHVKRRPQSADSAKVKKADLAKVENANSVAVKQISSVVSKTASCLNLKTYSEGLANDGTGQNQWPRKKGTISKTQRPLLCLT